METCPNCEYSENECSYIDDFVESSGDNIVAKGRQVGGTEMIVRSAIADANDGKKVCIIAPKYEIRMQIVNRVREKNDTIYKCYDKVISNSGGEINFLTPEVKKISQYDVVYIDEAQEIPKDILLGIDKADVETNIIFTPKRDSICNKFAEYNTKYTTWYIPSTSSPYLSADAIAQHKQYVSSKRFEREFEAKYWGDGEPDILPDRDYS